MTISAKGVGEIISDNEQDIGFAWRGIALGDDGSGLIEENSREKQEQGDCESGQHMCWV